MFENGLDYFSQLNPTDIWLIRQNKPKLIARDLAQYGVDQSITYSILLGRGVFKWLAVRRDLIKLKNVWKTRITKALSDLRQAKRDRDRIKAAYLRGYLKAYEECRAEVRALCHSERFRVQDDDSDAAKFLEGLRGGEDGTFR